MRAAFATAVAHLAASACTGRPSSWAWGRMHTRQFPSVTQADALGYGPRASGGDSWTVNAADGGLVSHQGPSWRMIVAGRAGAWDGHRRGHLPGRAEREPGLALVREPHRRLVERQLPAAPVRDPDDRDDH